MQSQADNKLAAGDSVGKADVGPLAGKVGYALRRAQLAVFDEIITAFAKLELAACPVQRTGPAPACARREAVRRGRGTRHPARELRRPLRWPGAPRPGPS